MHDDFTQNKRFSLSLCQVAFKVPPRSFPFSSDVSLRDPSPFPSTKLKGWEGEEEGGRGKRCLQRDWGVSYLKRQSKKPLSKKKEKRNNSHSHLRTCNLFFLLLLLLPSFSLCLVCLRMSSFGWVEIAGERTRGGYLFAKVVLRRQEIRKGRTVSLSSCCTLFCLLTKKSLSLGFWLRRKNGRRKKRHCVTLLLSLCLSAPIDR